MKKALALLMTVLMLASLIACANDTPPAPPQNDTTAPEATETTAAPETEETTLPPETEPEILPDLPDVGDKYKGTELSIVHRGTNVTHYKEPWIFAAQITGDTINDAVFKRNSYIEEKYGVKIVEYVNSDVDGMVDTAVQSQDDIYDIAFPQVNTTSTHILKGSYYSFTDLPYINTDMPWWDSNCVESTQYNGKYYLAISDISLATGISPRGIIFNRDLVRQYQLEDPYDLVKNNQWTLEKMATLVQAVSDNINGDDQWTDEDRYGMLTEGTGNIVTFITAAGQDIFVRNAEDEISFVAFNEQTIDIIELCSTFLKDRTYTRDYGDLSPDGELDKYQYGRKLFAENHFLLTQNTPLVFDELTQFNMESEYGIVPNPKWNSEQEGYLHKPDRNSTGLIIPGTNAEEDLERLSILIEDMAYMSSKTILPDYYETIIALRRARVPELGEMVDIIKNSIYYDITYIHNISWSDAVASAFQNSTAASSFQRHQRNIDNSIKQLVKKLDALG